MPDSAPTGSRRGVDLYGMGAISEDAKEGLSASHVGNAQAGGAAAMVEGSGWFSPGTHHQPSRFQQQAAAAADGAGTTAQSCREVSLHGV